MTPRELPIALTLEQAAARMSHRIATAHERVACPRCCADVGEPCRNITPSYRRGQRLKHSHKERLRADGINLR